MDNSGQFSPMESKNGGLKINGGNKVDVHPDEMGDGHLGEKMNGHPTNGSLKANGTLLQWETPSVPVIFVLGNSYYTFEANLNAKFNSGPPWDRLGGG